MYLIKIKYKSFEFAAEEVPVIVSLRVGVGEWRLKFQLLWGESLGRLPLR